MRIAVLCLVGMAGLAGGAWLIAAQRAPVPAATAGALERASAVLQAPAAATAPPAPPLDPASPPPTVAAPDPLPEPEEEKDAPQSEDDYGIEQALLPHLERYRSAPSADERHDALLDLALSDDPAVLDFLMDELHTARPLQRPPLIDAIVQYGDRRAIPELREAAAQAGAQERAALIEAAEYLALPTLTEFRKGLWKPGEPLPN